MKNKTAHHYLLRLQDLCSCLILICSIQHQMMVNLWTKNSYRPWLTNWSKTSKPLKTSVSLIGC
ncbi:hypothetical protein AWP91_24920 [Escherichia coli]|nr:hypothetical protein AWP46_25325 [Escherichia coli]OKX31397.1 hypothetical protein AWP91_24920 [Escherichia coli]